MEGSILAKPVFFYELCMGSIQPDTIKAIYGPHRLRGAVVEWLERLGYGAKSRRKVVNSSLGFAMRRLENSR